MTLLTIDSMCINGPLYPMIVNFKNGYPSEDTEDFEIDCTVLEDKNGNRLIVTEASGIIYAGNEENEILERVKNVSSETIQNDDTKGILVQDRYGQFNESCTIQTITNEANTNLRVMDHGVEHTGKNTSVNSEDRNTHKKDCKQEFCSLHSISYGARSDTLNNIKFTNNGSDLHSESRSYICHYCEKSFRTKPKLIVHIGTHNLVNKIKIGRKSHMTCKKNYKHDKNKHKSKNTKIKFFSCATCDYMTTQSNHRLEMHMITHTNEKPFKCHICDYTSNTNSNLKRHLLTHTQKLLNCKFCTRKFKEQGSLKIHIKTHDKTINAVTTQKYRNDSTQLHEEIILNKKKLLRNYICNYCRRAFISKPVLIAHIAVHENVTNLSKSNGKHQCVSCKAVFSTKSDLFNHSIKMHNFKDYKLCTICDYKTPYSSRLTIHMRVHTGQKPFKCDICDYTSKTSSDLKVHMRKHAKEKPYECTICYTKFTQKNSLKHHMNVHTGEKPHKCRVCDAKFAQPSGLRRHLIIHTGEKPYKCTICGRSFSDSSSLRRHEKTHAKVYSECGFQVH